MYGFRTELGPFGAEGLRSAARGLSLRSRAAAVLRSSMVRSCRIHASRSCHIALMIRLFLGHVDAKGIS